MENTVKEHLSQIFPQVDGYTIQNYLEEAKRRSTEENLADILTLCIDLILGGESLGQSETKQNFKPPNDDIIYLGSTNSKIEKYPVVYVDDETNEPITSSCNEIYEVKDLLCEPVTVDFNHSARGLDVSEGMAQPEQGSPDYTFILQSVLQMFPDADCNSVTNLAREGRSLEEIVNHLLEKPEICKPTVSQPLVQSPQTTKKDVNYFNEFSSPVSSAYKQQCFALLKNDFRIVSASNIRDVMKKYNGHYAPTRKCLDESLLARGHKADGSDTSSASFSIPKLHPDLRTSCNNSPTIIKTQLLGRKRKLVPLPQTLEIGLAEEIKFVQKQKMLKDAMKDKIYAMYLNEQQYEEEGQLIECGCCFGEFPFEEVVQCSDGHLFCQGCLHSYAKEVIFGSAIGTVKLHCMTDNCTKPFPYSQLKKSLSDEEIAKYQDRLQEDCLIKVDLPNLIQCPFCEFKAVVPENEKVFTCFKPTCRKVTCKDCQEEWKDHFGLKCSEVEKKQQTSLRVTYEERMTMAKVRKCSKCSCQFTKSEGCNKMTCRCGQTMCYICRMSGINYGHFCRHPRDPGQKCDKCTACSLWTDPSEDDELAVKQLEEEAKAAKRILDEDLISAKKQKV